MKLLHVRTSILAFIHTCVLIFTLTYLLTYLLANLLTYICANILSHAIPVLTLIPTFALANFMWHMLGSLPTKFPLVICKIDGTHQLPHAIIRFDLWPPPQADRIRRMGCRTCPIHWSRANPRSKEWLDTPDAPRYWGYLGKALNDVDVSSRDKSTDSI